MIEQTFVVFSGTFIALCMFSSLIVALEKYKEKQKKK